MTRLTWGAPVDRVFDAGVDRGVLYLPVGGVYSNGFPWNGLTTVTESPSGAEANPQYADNGKYLNLQSAEDFGATVEALAYPRQFAQCDGSASPNTGVYVGQQSRRPFGMSYRTLKGNADVGTDLGYKLHLVYGAQAAPSEKANATINDSPEPLGFSWELSTTPVPVTGLKATAHLFVDSTEVTAAQLTALENALYGTAGSDPRLPLPDEVIAMMAGSLTSVTPVAPSYNSSTHVITVPNTTGVVYRRSDTNAVVTNSTITLTTGQNLIIYAVPANGFVFPANVDDDFGFSF